MPHLGPEERAAIGLAPCPLRGQTSGPSGPTTPFAKRKPTTRNKQVRLPEVLRVAIVEAAARGATFEDMATALHRLGNN